MPMKAYIVVITKKQIKYFCLFVSTNIDVSFDGRKLL